LAKWASFVFAGDDIFLGDNEFTRPTLRGLKEVGVLVEDLGPEIERSGLSITQIQTDVELRLRMAGIKVLSKEEYFETPWSPYLYVHVNVFKAEAIRAYVYSISVELEQDVYLARIFREQLVALEKRGLSPEAKESLERGKQYFDIVKFVKLAVLTFLTDMTGSEFPRYKATTWSRGCVGVDSKLGEIRASVKDLVDAFINAYLSVNPTKPGERNK
jgi:hypothetical protein